MSWRHLVKPLSLYATRVPTFARNHQHLHPNYSYVIMSAMASQITGVSVVYSTVCSGADHTKHQSFASLALWGETTCDRCRRSSSTQEQRYPPPLPLGATAPPTCGRRKSDPGLRVTTQDQEYPLRKLREIRDINLIAGYLYVIYYMNT